MSELLPKYPAAMRNAATRCYPPNNRNSGITRCMARSYHIARETLVNPSVIYPFWAFNGAGESDAYAGATIKVGIEYPIGSAVVLSNENITAGGMVSHPIGNTTLTFTKTIPKNAAFYMSVYVIGPNGVVWTLMAGGVQGGTWAAEPGEYCDLGTSNNDKVTAGTNSPGSSGAVYCPIAILSSTRCPSVLIIGDSRPAGGAGSVPSRDEDTGPEARIIGPVLPYTNCGISATLQSGWNSGSHTYLNQLIAAGYWTHVINTYGTNDIGGGQSAATIAASRATCAANLKAQKSDLVIIGETIYPYIGSSDVFVTKSNQSLGTNQPRVFTLNAAIRAGIAGEDRVWDIADAIDPTREGLYPVSRDTSAASRTPASCTAGTISGTTFTVAGTVTGTFKPGDPLYDAGGNVKDSTYIVEQLTGTTGVAGTYRINKTYNGSYPNPSAVTATTITTAGVITRDGLHLQFAGEELVIDRKGTDLLAKIAA